MRVMWCQDPGRHTAGVAGGSELGDDDGRPRVRRRKFPVPRSSRLM